MSCVRILIFVLVRTYTYLDLAHLGGHARHIVPPLSPSQPVIADEKISCWGKEPSRSSLLSLLFVTFSFLFFFKSRFLFFRCFAFFQLRVRVRVLLVYVFGFLSFSHHKKSCFIFLSLSVNFFSFGFSLQVTREDKAT